MELETTDSSGITIVTIRGSVDGSTSEELTARLIQLAQSGSTRLVADFAGVTYTSSAGLRALLASLKEARQRGGDLRLARVHQDVYRVLQLSGFTGILKLYPDLDSAVASYA
jgi:anti-sigma B factor antagonist